MKFIYYNLLFILVTLTSCSNANNRTTLFQNTKLLKFNLNKLEKKE
jgi:hypothetical protein